MFTSGKGLDHIIVNGDMTGRELMKLIFPSYDGVSIIRKKNINGIARLTMRDMGTKAITFMSAVYRFLDEWLVQNGSTICLEDCTATFTNEHRAKVKDYVDRVGVINLQAESYTHVRAQVDHVDVEDKTLQVLSRARAYLGKIALEQLKDGWQVKITDSGAKGSDANVVQNSAMNGQQLDAMSKRPTTSTSHVYLSHAASRGFVENSYVDGMTATECFHHQRSARTGLVAQAVTTQRQGTKIHHHHHHSFIFLLSFCHCCLLRIFLIYVFLLFVTGTLTDVSARHWRMSEWSSILLCETLSENW